jgi:hypothetical protein
MRRLRALRSEWRLRPPANLILAAVYKLKPASDAEPETVPGEQLAAMFGPGPVRMD